MAGLKEGPDGVLYGTTTFGGSANLGTVFKLNKNGRSFKVLHSFSGTGGKGAQPYAGLVFGSDGALYGTTAFGGDSERGTLFSGYPRAAAVTACFAASLGQAETDQSRMPDWLRGARRALRDVVGRWKLNSGNCFQRSTKTARVTACFTISLTEATEQLHTPL